MLARFRPGPLTPYAVTDDQLPTISIGRPSLANPKIFFAESSLATVALLAKVSSSKARSLYAGPSGASRLFRTVALGRSRSDGPMIFRLHPIILYSGKSVSVYPYHWQTSSSPGVGLLTFPYPQTKGCCTRPRCTLFARRRRRRASEIPVAGCTASSRYSP